MGFSWLGVASNNICRSSSKPERAEKGEEKGHGMNKIQTPLRCRQGLTTQVVSRNKSEMRAKGGRTKSLASRRGSQQLKPWGANGPAASMPRQQLPGGASSGFLKSLRSLAGGATNHRRRERERRQRTFETFDARPGSGARIVCIILSMTATHRYDTQIFPHQTAHARRSPASPACLPHILCREWLGEFGLPLKRGIGVRSLNSQERNS